MREIRNRLLFRQRIFWGDMDFDGLSFTDIDAYMNYYDKILIFIELKKKGKDIGYAQKNAFTKMCDNLKIPSIFIIAWHDQKNNEEDVKLRLCIVYKYYYKKKWYETEDQNLSQFISKVINKYKGA